MSDLYDTDILLWSERQAALLRRRAAGELLNEAELDWSNIAEEIEDVGSEQRQAAAAGIDPHSVGRGVAALPRRAHWLAEAQVFRAQARRRFVPAMKQRIDGRNLCRRSPRLAGDDRQPVAVARAGCGPWTLDDLLSDDP